MSEPLTMLAWLWSQPDGRTQYTAHYANIWADKIRRNLTLPHRIALVTDMPEGIDPDIEIIPPPRDFEDVRIPTWKAERPQCLRRLAMFRPDAAKLFGNRFVCMDLDCVISGNLDSLFDVPDDFKMLIGSAPRRPYNGSMLLMTAGARPQVYEQFTPDGAVEAGRRFTGSDQAWISYALGPGEATWGEADGVFRYRSPRGENCRIVFFLGNPKPWEVIAEGRDDWVAEHYHADPRGRCLVLGYGPDVWADAADAIARYGSSLPIIASPEAARHCDTVLAVAEDDEQADRLAQMYGYESVWCGRSEADVRVAA